MDYSVRTSCSSQAKRDRIRARLPRSMEVLRGTGVMLRTTVGIALAIGLSAVQAQQWKNAQRLHPAEGIPGDTKNQPGASRSERVRDLLKHTAAGLLDESNQLESSRSSLTTRLSAEALIVILAWYGDLPVLKQALRAFPLERGDPLAASFGEAGELFSQDMDIAGWTPS